MSGKFKTYTAHIPVEDYQRLDELVKRGFFTNRGEAIREAIRRLCEEYKPIMEGE